jgi:hypothetical protein
MAESQSNNKSFWSALFRMKWVWFVIPGIIAGLVVAAYFSYKALKIPIYAVGVGVVFTLIIAFSELIRMARQEYSESSEHLAEIREESPRPRPFSDALRLTIPTYPLIGGTIAALYFLAHMQLVLMLGVLIISLAVWQALRFLLQRGMRRSS